jgi:hypothetical protein
MPDGACRRQRDLIYRKSASRKQERADSLQVRERSSRFVIGTRARLCNDANRRTEFTLDELRNLGGPDCLSIRVDEVDKSSGSRNVRPDRTTWRTQRRFLLRAAPARIASNPGHPGQENANRELHSLRRAAPAPVESTGATQAGPSHVNREADSRPFRGLDGPPGATYI